MAKQRQGSQRIGLLGGTFDPIHVGHLIVADEIRTRCNLEKVVLVPAAQPPHKAGACVASAEARAAMVSLGIRGHPCLELSTAELERKGPSYTVDTLRDFRKQHPKQAEIFFIIGSDNVPEIPEWKCPEEIMRLCTVVVASRPGATTKSVDSVLASQMSFVPVPLIEVSSSDIRRRIRSGEPYRFLVPPSVAAYIRRHGLYRE